MVTYLTNSTYLLLYKILGIITMFIRVHSYTCTYICTVLTSFDVKIVWLLVNHNF